LEHACLMNSSRILEIYEDFAKARMDRISEILDEKIDFISHAPTDVFPYLGRRRGRVEVLEALAEVHDKLEVLSFWPLSTVVDGDQAALTVLINVKDRTTGKTANFLAAHFLRFRKNLIVEYRAIIDSLDAVRQLSKKAAECETEPEN
jgi:hypothetical protein